MIAALYKTKKECREHIGRPLRYRETSLYGNEFTPDGQIVVVGPSETERKWYGQIVMENGLIKKVI